MASIAAKIGCTIETLRLWVAKSERDSSGASGGDVSGQLKALERENCELRQANEILRKASASERPLHPGAPQPLDI